MINGDPVSIRQILHNLIKNALEAIDAQGLIEISLHRVRKNNTDFIEIALYDDGRALKMSKLKRFLSPM